MDEQLLNVSNSNKTVSGETKKTAVQPPQMKGKVKVKKRNGLIKFAEAFLPDDVSDVKSYILVDVIIPSIKKVIDEIFHIMLWGDTNTSYFTRRSSSHTSYQNYYDRKNSQNSSRMSKKSDSSIYILDEDFVFDYEEDAENFVRWMLDVIAEDSFIRLSEANEYVGRTGYYTDTHYGWTNLNGWKIINTGRAEGRYVLKLPRPFPVD